MKSIGAIIFAIIAMLWFMVYSIAGLVIPTPPTTNDLIGGYSLVVVLLLLAILLEVGEH